jgi:hypothetical protein
MLRLLLAASMLASATSPASAQTRDVGVRSGRDLVWLRTLRTPMNSYKRLTVALMMPSMLLVAVGQAAEKKISRAELPAAVEKTVAAESSGATIKGFSTEIEGGRRIYEMELVLNGHGRDVSMDDQGQIIEVEEEVTFASLPQTVKEGLTGAAGAGTISKVESLTKKGRLVAYEAVVLKGKTHSEIQVGPDGKKLAHPE